MNEHLRDLGHQLIGGSWRDKYPDDMTPEERAAMMNSTPEEFFDWVTRMWGEPE